jgi:hypothetical protein
MRCYVHPRCEVSGIRVKLTDEFMLRWLFKAVHPELGADAETKRELRKRHFEEWQAMKAALLEKT